jgi:hypothetical protein
MHTHRIIIEPNEEIYEQEEFSYAARLPRPGVQRLQKRSFDPCLASDLLGAQRQILSVDPESSTL